MTGLRGSLGRLARISAFSWPRVGDGAAPSKPPIGSASSPLSSMNTEASAAVWVASRSRAPFRPASSCGIVSRTWAGVWMNSALIAARLTAGSKGVSNRRYCQKEK